MYKIASNVLIKRRTWQMTGLKRGYQSYNNIQINKAGIKLELREMVPSEKDKVLALNKYAFDGLDFLPEYLDYFMKDPQRLCFTAHKENEMVAFFVAQFVDNKESMLIQAGRVKENLTGTGIYRALTRFIPEFALESGCKRILAIEGPGSHRSTFQKQLQSDIAAKVLFITSEIGSRQIAECSQRSVEGNSENIKRVIPSDILNDYCTSQTVKDYLFPSGRFLVEYCALSLIPENVLHMNGRNSYHFSSVRENGTEIAGMLSSAHILKHLNGIHSYNISITGSDTADLEGHLELHCSRAVCMIPGPFCFQILVEDTCLQQLFLFLEKKGIIKPSRFAKIGRVFVYEIDVTTELEDEKGKHVKI